MSSFGSTEEYRSTEEDSDAEQQQWNHSDPDAPLSPQLPPIAQEIYEKREAGRTGLGKKFFPGDLRHRRYRNERKDRDPYPCRAFLLPSPRHKYSYDSDSEDDTPDMNKILNGKRYNAIIFNDSQFINTHTDDILAEEHGQLEEQNTLVAPHSCSYCKKLLLDLRPVLPTQFRFGGGWFTEDGKTNFTLADATDARDRGCHLFNNIMEDPRGVHDHWNRDSQSLKLSITMREPPLVSFRVGKRIEFEVYAAAGTTLPSTFPLQRLPPNLLPNSPMSFSRIRSWTNECAKGHINCQYFSTCFTPKRLLQVSGGAEAPTIRLSTHHPQATYATLSYCWGGAQENRTTSKNIDKYYDSIPFHCLPKTIQDAVIVTEKIGLSYLWVDALCIIQDDDRDKDEQISRMDKIFRGSFITIAAVEAVSSTVGFLHPRERWRPTRVRARFDDNVFSNVLLVISDPEYVETSIRDPRDKPSKLFTRGWTFQETQLSTRILLYGKGQLIYTCIEAIHSDGGIIPSRDGIVELVDPGHQVYAAMQHPYSWGAMVCDYSKRELTVADDKLPGIAALATEYSLTRNVGHYYAGLWERDFLEQCLWKPIPSLQRNIRQLQNGSPSWSWASLDCEIEDIFLSLAGQVFGAVSSYETFKITCELVDVHTTLVAPEHVFSRVKNGFMILRGKMRQIACFGANQFGNPGFIVSDEESDGSGCDNGEEPDARRPATRDEEIRCFLDVPDEWPERNNFFWSIEILDRRNACHKVQTCLLLREQDNRPGSFKRVGLLHFEKGTADSYSFKWAEIIIY